jgi:hypothetical protein
MQFYSGPLIHFLSGVDSLSRDVAEVPFPDLGGTRDRRHVGTENHLTAVF